MSKDYLENKDFLDQLGIDYNLNGSEAKFHHCPLCESADNFTNPYNLFHVNIDKGVYQCFHKNSCGAQGSIYNLKLRLGMEDPLQGSTRKSYVKPKALNTLFNAVSEFYGWYEKNRGIKKEILEKYKVGKVEKYGNQYAVYQYINSDGDVFNRKYKSMSDKKKVHTEKNAQQGYYGLQFVDFKKDPSLYVCEGEDDCHALAQYGIPNIVSVPFGANNYNIEMDKINSQAKNILLFFDCDEKGQKGAYNFAKKAGLHKCHNVLLPYKDARDCILRGVTNESIYECLSQAKQFKNEEVNKAADLKSEVEDVLYGKRTLGYMTANSDFNRVTKGIRLSELTILTGHSGSGKTTFGYNVIDWMLGLNVPCMSMSFENRMSSILLKMIAIHSMQTVREYDENEGKHGKMVVRMPRETLDSHINELDRLPLYFLNKDSVKDGYYDIEKMEEVIKYAVKYYNVKLFLIDHLHYFLKLSDARNPVQKLDESIRRIKQWTERFNIAIILIVHPSKPSGKDDSKITLYSGKGTSSIAQEADNFWAIYQLMEDQHGYKALLEQLKNREFGLGGNNSVEFKVMENKSTFIQRGFQ